MNKQNSTPYTKNNARIPTKEYNSINNDLYLNIDSKDNFNPIKKEDLESLNKFIKHFEDRENMNKEKLTKKILYIYFSKYYPNCEGNALQISHIISRQIRENKKLSSENAEKYINYFYALRYEIRYSTSFKLNKEGFRNLGYLFCFIYKNFHKYKIKEIEILKGLINSVVDIHVDVITDFYNYCSKKGLDPEDSNVSKIKMWSEMNKKYDLPPELIFLINIFQKIDTLDINIFFEGEVFDDDDLKLFTITILNINYILIKLKTVKINLIHNKLQNYLYLRYYQKVLDILNNNKEWFKKNKIEN